MAERKSLDQFYTNSDVAIRLWTTYQTYMPRHNYILEPSAGTGSFYNLLPVDKRIGIDLEPKAPGIIRQDFLEFKPEEKKRYIVIGNPPFGKCSSLAIKFFNKCAEFADLIGFIIPRTFKRISIQNKLNLDFNLIWSEDLPVNPCCFTPQMGAKCCFQIWKRGEPRVSVVLAATHDDFDFLPYGPLDAKGQPTPPAGADFVIKAYGSNCGSIKINGLDELRPKSWHWIKANIDISTLKNRFNSLDYSVSKDTVRQDSIGKRDLIQLYSAKY